MEIIKVVHSETEENSANEKQSFTLQTYEFNIEEYYLRKKSQKNIFSKEAMKDMFSPRNIAKASFNPFRLTLADSIIGELSGQNKLDFENVVQEISKDIIEDIYSHSQKLRVVSLNTAKIEYPRTQNLSIGTYTLHPYDRSRLTRLESYHTNLAMEKDDELIILLGKMGAKNIRIMEQGSKSKSADGKIDIENLAIDIKGKLDISQRTINENDLLVSFEGNIVDIDPNLLVNSLWFSTDSKLHSIFESRRFNPNKIQQYTLKNTYTETFDFDFDLASKYLLSSLNVKAQYNSLCQKERLFHVEFSKE
jgi:hypothetical protein